MHSRQELADCAETLIILRLYRIEEIVEEIVRIPLIVRSVVSTEISRSIRPVNFSRFRGRFVFQYRSHDCKSIISG